MLHLFLKQMLKITRLQYLPAKIMIFMLIQFVEKTKKLKFVKTFDIFIKYVTFLGNIYIFKKVLNIDGKKLSNF